MNDSKSGRAPQRVLTNVLDILSGPPRPKTCPDCNRPAGKHYADRCDSCYEIHRKKRDKRLRRNLNNPHWWIQGAVSALKYDDFEDARDALIEACRVLSRKIRRTGA